MSISFTKKIEKGKPITLDEWERYEWIPVPGDKTMFIRGIEKADPPDDGYKYIDVTTTVDIKQRWMRAVEGK